MHADTIFAPATPAGRSAVAIVRMSGPQSGAALAALAGSLPPPRHAMLRRLRDPADDSTLDRALVLWLPGPDSPTGEDCAEFHVHGGQAVMAALLAVLARQPGCRPAEAGAFTRRAFANGRMDLVAVEALTDLVDAETESQRRQALEAERFGQQVETWRAALIEALAWLEAEIDFADEADVADVGRGPALAAIVPVAAALGDVLARQGRAEIVRDGFTVVIAGPPNAGKSTLLNALAGRDAALVSPQAGTTRDAIEVRLDVDGLLIWLVDTAGLRESDDFIEQAGMARALARAAEADLVLWLDPLDEPRIDPPLLAKPVLRVVAKMDCASSPPPAGAISALTGAGLDALLDRIAAEARAAAGPPESRLLTRTRQRAAAEDALCHLQRVLADPALPVELMAEDIRLAARALAMLIGRIDVDDWLDAIFARFCIGK